MATLARQAATGGRPEDLFGLLAASGQHALAIPVGYNSVNTGGGGTTTPPVAPPPIQPEPPGGGTEITPKPGTDGTGQPPNPPPKPGQYDVSSDPVLQQVNAAMVLADEAARARALRDRQQALVAYGDAGLAGSILGANDPYVLAAGQNQESTLAQLLRSYQGGLRDFTMNLDPSLAFSGYRVGNEGEIGQAYQDNLASAANAIQSQLGGYTDTLNAALAADQEQRINALADAYARAVQSALAGGK